MIVKIVICKSVLFHLQNIIAVLNELVDVQGVNDKLGLILTIVFFIYQVKAVSF